MRRYTGSEMFKPKASADDASWRHAALPLHQASMTSPEDKMSLAEAGERVVVREITSLLQPSVILVDGLGHDAAFLDVPVGGNEILVVNTDRSGISIAYQLGLADGECVGDLGVSHAVSDVIAAGGVPKAVTVALLMPSDTEIGFVRQLMRGAERSAARYGAVIAGGDTKQNPKFAMVVTAIGTAPRNRRLTRSGARPGDLLVVTGYLGSMLLGMIALRNDIPVEAEVRAALERALIEQRPPFTLGRAIADALVAHACMDISDGLAGAVFAVCSASGVGAVIDEALIPADPTVLPLANSLSLRPMQLACGGGDWQFLYAIAPERFARVEELAASVGGRVTCIGRVTKAPAVVARTVEGSFRHLNRIEHDSFADGAGGRGYFSTLEVPQTWFGDFVEPPSER
jgi:thiamine-monophosphate kinase